MADLRDEHGNPIQLADQYGKPVQLTDEYGNPMHLTDEYGNPMHLTGVATIHPGHTAVTSGGGFELQIHEPPPIQQELQHQPHEENKRSSSSNSSSSENDEQVGRRRKKKGLKEKIKEKLSVGKNKDKDEAAHRSTPAATTPESKSGTTTPGQEKKGVFDKIKEN